MQCDANKIVKILYSSGNRAKKKKSMYTFNIDVFFFCLNTFSAHLAESMFLSYLLHAGTKHHTKSSSWEDGFNFGLQS